MILLPLCALSLATYLRPVRAYTRSQHHYTT
jgi:hypothetical protein